MGGGGGGGGATGGSMQGGMSSARMPYVCIILSQGHTESCPGLLLAEAATSITLVATKVGLPRQKCVFVSTNSLFLSLSLPPSLSLSLSLSLFLSLSHSIYPFLSLSPTPKPTPPLPIPLLSRLSLISFSPRRATI